MPALIVLASDDLLVGSRVELVAHHLGYALRQVRTPNEFWAAIDERPALVLLGTRGTRLAWEDLLDQLKGRPDPPPVLAFGPHLDAEERARARRAGVTRWVPNSRLASDLPQLIRELARSVPASGQE